MWDDLANLLLINKKSILKFDFLQLANSLLIYIQV